MSFGNFYGIGIGPGDPELITLKGRRLLSTCRNIFVPKADPAAESIAVEIAGPHLKRNARIRELVFPMTADRLRLAEHWEESARTVAAVLEKGEDVCFLTLGDPFLYSTYIYLLRALRTLLPTIKTVTVPGITSFSAAASLTEFVLGEGKEPVTIVPTTDDLEGVMRAIAGGGTIVIMKIGKRLKKIIDMLNKENLIDQAVFVSRAGLAGERIETDLKRLPLEKSEAGYLSIILVHAGRK